MASLSFKFSKTSEKKVLADSKLRDISTKDNDEGRDFIKDVKDKAIIGTLKPKESDKPLVIPLIKQNHWRTSKPVVNGDHEVKEKKVTESDNEEQHELSLMEEAAKEILEETARELNEWESRTDKGRLDNNVPTVIANAAPSSFENDEHLNVSLRAEASTIEDYENVPIEQYGMAMLRGMGWKPGDGIGGYKKQVVQIFDPQSRPKGLGLGATRPKTDQAVAKEGEEKLTLKRGAFVLVEGGAKRGQYGEVEGLDEENGRVLLKMGVGKEIASVSENVIKLVTKTEFKEKGKVLNLDKYEKYKEKERIKKEEERNRQRTPEKRRYKDGEKYSRKSRSWSRDHDAKERYEKSPEVKRVKKSKTWVRPLLRVRCIDSKVKGGKYYNVKMEVLDVVTNESCDCRTDEGKLVENIRTDKVETLIPKKDGGRVMVVRGERKGDVGQVIGRDKVKYLATVQLYQSEEVVTLDYDYVCEYLGEVPDYD